MNIKSEEGSNFLTNIKFIEVANGPMSEDVLSGMPQGTVLALVLSIIISDTDKKKV